MWKPKIKWHCDTNFTDVQSISLIENILSSHKKVMPKLDKIDKWPNIDWHLEIQNEDTSLFWKISVQVKTLPQNHKLKFSCPISFLTYCELEPCLFFWVDNQEEKIYWLYFDSQVIKSINFKNNKYSKIINFDKDKFFEKNNCNYYNEWRKIIEINQEKYQNYDSLKEAYHTLLENTNIAIWKENQIFKNIHIFLDTLNWYFDNEFYIVKSRFYPNQWKIWLAYYEYKPNTITYTLYPIPYNKNDVQIKEVWNDIKRQIEMQSLGFVWHFAENPIETRPKEYAKEKIKEKTLKVIENKLLNHTWNDFLAREFIFAFIDEFYEQMWLEKWKNIYSIDEIKDWFYNFLPLWLDEAHNLLLEKNRNNYKERLQNWRVQFLDPNCISEIIWDEKNIIKENVVKKLKDWKLKTKNYPIWNKKFPFGIFVELFESIKTVNIERLYKIKDYSNLEKKKSAWVWDILTKEDTEYNFKLIVENLLEVYNNFINSNFLLLKEELSIFENNSNKILFSIELKENYENHIWPWYKIFYLKSNSNLEKNIEFINYDEIEKLDFPKTDRILKYKWIDYEIISYSSGILDFLYEETPMLNLIYKKLERRMKCYF